MSALQLKIGHDMLRLADECTVERNGFQRAQGWVGYRDWGDFKPFLCSESILCAPKTLLFHIYLPDGPRMSAIA